MTTNDELRSMVRTSLRLALAYREEATALKIRDEAFSRRGTLHRLEEDLLRAAKQDRQVLADRNVSPDSELQDLWARAFPHEGDAS